MSITNQPSDNIRLQQIDNTPQGLEFLRGLDRIIIKQKVERLEAFIGFETKNRYVLKNERGEQLAYAFEESGALARNFLGDSRGFTIRIINAHKQEVMSIKRPFKLLAGDASLACCSEFANECNVSTPQHGVIGNILELQSMCAPEYQVQMVDGSHAFHIAGEQMCLVCGCEDKEFMIHSPRYGQIGDITRKSRGLAHDIFTDSDMFQVTLPRELEVKAKAVLLGATFLIDFIHFERP